jgi:hypothetical protein
MMITIAAVMMITIAAVMMITIAAVMMITIATAPTEHMHVYMYKCVRARRFSDSLFTCESVEHLYNSFLMDSDAFD